MLFRSATYGLPLRLWGYPYGSVAHQGSNPLGNLWWGSVSSFILPTKPIPSIKETDVRYGGCGRCTVTGWPGLVVEEVLGMLLPPDTVLRSTAISPQSQ